MGRAPCCDKANVKKGPWSPEEDVKLKEYIEKYGTGGNWIALPQKAGLKRCGKSCRLRWLNYLRPNIKHGEFTEEEDRVILSLFATIGSRWSIIAAHLPGRTDNDIKNYWNTKLKKKLNMAMSSSSSPFLSQRNPVSPLIPSSSIPQSSPLMQYSSHQSLTPSLYKTSSVSNHPPTNYFEPFQFPNPSSLFQIQEEGFVNSAQCYNNPIKENYLQLMFGNNNDHHQTSTTAGSSPDGSYGSHGKEIKQEDRNNNNDICNLFQGYNSNYGIGFEENHQKLIMFGSSSSSNGGFAETTTTTTTTTTPSSMSEFYYSLEEDDVKQLMMIKNSNNGSADDENKIEEKVMYQCQDYFFNYYS